MEARRAADDRHHARVQIGELIRRLYGAFVLWVSVYEDTDDGNEQDARQEQVSYLLSELSVRYLPQSVWIEKTDRKKIEGFIDKAEDLYAMLSEEIEKHGYPQVRSNVASRVSKELGPLRREAEASLGVEAPASRRQRRSGRLSLLSRST